MTVVKPQSVQTAADGGDSIARLGKQAYNPGACKRLFVGCNFTDSKC